MVKNIVICIDGTGNTPSSGGGTNVFRLFNAVDINGHRSDSSLCPQVAYYDEGVGTEHSRVIRAFSGATGRGMVEKIKRLYTQLVMVYSPGDRLFFFGFSRGAFTIRHIVALIDLCGIVDPTQSPGLAALQSKIDDAISDYWRALSGRRPRRPRFTENDTILKPGIDFVGVWDTVGSVGTPFESLNRLLSRMYPLTFPDHRPSRLIRKACQCLAIDEERLSFRPVLWSTSYFQTEVEQVWFPGVHSNVGGGYERAGLSLIALDWMMTRAEERGLRFRPTDRKLSREYQSSNDKIYDSRIGLASLYRWRPRDIGSLSTIHGVSHPCIHISVFQRILTYTDFYAPGNIPSNFTLVEADGKSAREISLDEITNGDCSATHAKAAPWLAFGFAAQCIYLLSLIGAVAIVVSTLILTRAAVVSPARYVLLGNFAIGAFLVAVIASVVTRSYLQRRRRLYLSFWLRHRNSLWKLVC